MIMINAISFGQNITNSSDTIKYNTWSASISGGSMLFFGDVKQFDFYPLSKKNSEDWYGLQNGISERKWGFGLNLSKQLTPVFAIQGMLENGNLAGMKDTIKSYFNASILTCSINMKINILPIINPYLKDHKISVYGIFGIGLSKFKTIERNIPTDTIIFSYGYGAFNQEKKRTTETVVPIGAGIKYRVTNNMDIGIESILNNVNTYKLDGGNEYNSAEKDKYLYTSLNITYTFGKNKSLEWAVPKEKESEKYTPAINALNQKIDSLNKKLADAENKNIQEQKAIDDLKNHAKEEDINKTNAGTKAENNTKESPIENNEKAVTPPVLAQNAQTAVMPELLTKVSVFFSVNSSDIDDLNQEKIEKVAEMLTANKDINLDLIGNSDKTGGELYNEILSKRRALSVFDVLVNEYGIDAARLNIIAKSDKEPLSKNIFYLNRRVDIVIKK
jgi:OOP family OmpA-OmpF porin